MSEVTRILQSIEAGDKQAGEQLLPLVYAELRKLAAARMAAEAPGNTLSATALVHEAYLRLVKPEVRSQELGVDTETSEVGSQKSESSLPTPDPRSPTPGFDSRGHFFAAAAESMRRILVDAARSRARLKRGGQATREELCESLLASDAPTDDLLGIHEALDRLESHDPQAAQLVKLRYFMGMQHQETADALGISRRQADGLWTLARAWLRRELKT